MEENLESVKELDVAEPTEEVADEVTENAPYNILIRVSEHDEVFIKKNSRNIASTMAARLGTWKFPIVSVKPSMLMEKPGQFEVSVERGGKR